MHDERIATMIKNQKIKDAKAKIIEDKEDETERKRAAEDKRRYDELQKRIESQKKKSAADAKAQKTLHDKQLKAEKDGRQSDVERYRQQLLDMIKKNNE